ncbi:ExeM/NucH family extracellular endonuclease [uncultured Paraglaciecola sp.]|uniref:ExeM/NucH family extracellular endonuclease n=1 Tax=uncultured Paraglaciecola sp. TaxID=1765024 RepID=UPI002632054F|nr:ExeM/NucH family extracellular endonuclease [uncultured Paraglaciecola sp.]
MSIKYSVALALLCASSAQATNVFINEIHYDNASTDVGEFFEIAAPIGTDLTDWSVALYNGNNGGTYGTIDLSTETLVENAGYGFVAISPSSIQNGSPDGLALIDNLGAVVQFLSYEGAMTATSGPASGLTSEDMGVSETGATPVGFSLQLAGSGSVYADFAWQSPAVATSGAANNDQTFVEGGGGDPSEPDVISGSVCTSCPDVPIIKDLSLYDAAAYYAAAQTEVDLGSSADVIKTAINDIIATDHKNLSYSDVWTSLTYTDEDPENTDNVILWYSNRSQAKSTNGSGPASNNPDNWNREHSWPRSHGFSSDSYEAHNDIHHLRATDISINGSRGNLDFDNSDSPLSESPNNRVDGDSFEPRDEIKGDVARMMFYMDTRYEASGSDSTPDLVLVNRLTSTSEDKLGLLCTLVAWSAADPVDASEQLRNNRIYELQGNRNPFIDNPAWVEVVYPAAECDSNGGGDDGGGDDGGGDDGGGDDPTATSGVVFISEYIEGSSFNKAIELYNPTANSIDLAAGNYVLSRYSNGGTSPSAISLTGIIPANGTYVVANTQANADILDKADQISGSISHNGDDDYVLTADGTVLDAFGQVGVDPGSSYGSGEFATANNTLIRNPDVYSGDTVVDDVFDPSIEWTGRGNNNSDDLGMHTITPQEIYFSEYIEGSSSNKALEIYNPSGTELDLAAGNYSVELYSNGRELSEGPTNSLNLTGTIAGGDVYVIANSSAVQAILDEADTTSTITFFNGDDALVLLKDGVPIDSIGRVGEDPGSAWTGNGVSTANNTIVRKASITSGDTILDDVFDPSVEWEGFPSNTFDNLGSHNGGSDDGGTGVCCDEVTFIHDVQGSGDTSSLVGEMVKVEGVVTASLTDISGFFVQEEDADADADPATSEAVFVAYSGDLPAVGSLVSVIGSVSENFARTQLTASEAPEILSTGNAAPAVSALTLPFANSAEAETMEGMLVATAQALVVTDNYALGRYGEVTLSSERLFTPTNVFAPGSTQASELEAANALNRILLDDGNSAGNPEVVVYPTGGLSAANTLRLGDTVASLTGIMDYSFGNYRVIPTQDPTFVATNARTAEPDLALGNLKVASLNVLNYFNNIDGNGSICGPTASSSCRGADSELEFERQKAKTVAAIVAMDADIVGLMEIENNGFAAGSAIDDLVTAINAIMGEGTYSIVNPGAPIGTDAITVAFIYKSSVVSLSGAAQILDSSNSISDENGPLFKDNKNRPALTQEFALLENGESLVISVNHLKSKGSGCGAGDDSTNGQGNCNLTRTRAAQALSAFLAAQFPEKATLIIGDLNSHAKEDPINALEQAGYTNLVEQFGGDTAYSYSFSGLLGYLDHALGNDQALDKVVDVTEWHINADEPISLDYNVEFKAEANISNYYAPDAYRMSDHDPVLIALQLEAETLVGDWDSDGDVDINDIRALTRAIQFGQVIDLSFDFNNDGIVNIRDVRGMSALCTRTRCAA